MKQHIKHPMRLLLCLMAALLFAPFSLANNGFKQIRFGTSDDTSRLVLEFQSEPTYTYFALKNPDRIVVDIAGVSNDFSLSDVAINSPVVKKVRHSTPKTPEDTRLVIEMTKALVPTLYTLPASSSAPPRLVIELVDPNPPAQNIVINSAAPNRDKDIIIVIDAGHGGVDPGSIGPAGTYEKRITLSIAKMLEDRINSEPGLKAVMTRNGDYYISPNDRPKVAVKANADLMISIHADAFSTPQPRGGSVWVLSKGRADSELGRLLEQTERSSELLGAAAEVIEDRDTERYFAETILNMSMDLFRASSYELSNKMIREMKGVTKMHKKTPQSASFAVLTAPETPSILVEVGFISNPQEEKNLNWKEHRERLADAMFTSIKAFFKKTPPDGTLWAQWKQNAPQQHKVASGESLSLLAQRYGVTVNRLKSENNLSSDLVRVGQMLTIPSS
ncbi:N-acetylmuramoyl-L-alanine amidase [Glaciecola siphonariae]|uniref:N-acetylmuramoyl-L-alanine amidase n=1 Tax=Glaciecola siphonariae TaxID=521012 RepID=A0ABV9LY51_9ALTE